MRRSLLLQRGHHDCRVDAHQATSRRQISTSFHSVTSDVNSYSQLAISADGQTLATVFTNVDSSIAFYKPKGGTPVSTAPLRVTPLYFAWANEERLLFIIPRVAIGWVDRDATNVQNFDTGEIEAGYSISGCADGHILFTGFPKGVEGSRVFRMDADGGNIVQLTTTGVARSPECSPDSRQVYYSVAGGSVNLASFWVVPLAGGTPRQVLPTQNTNRFRLSGDGRRLRKPSISRIGAETRQ